MTGTPARDVTGYVLAGGLSRRMKQDKAFLQISGEPLIELALRNLRPVCAIVKILSGPVDVHRDALLAGYAPLVHDREAAHNGPLGGLQAALHDALTPYVLLLPVDQPGLSAEALISLAAAGIAAGAAAACFAAAGVPQPLPLLGSQTLRTDLDRVLAAGDRRLLETVEACCQGLGRPVLRVDAPTSAPELFRNLNTPADVDDWTGRTSSNHSEPDASELLNG